MWFGKKKGDKDSNQIVAQFNQLLLNSFGQVKQDMKHVFDWLNYLYRQNIHQQRTIAHFQQKLSQIQLQFKEPLSKEDIKRIVDSHYDYNGILNKLKQVEHRIDQLNSLKQD